MTSTKTQPRPRGSRSHVGVPAELAVNADRDRLRQALANLVDNAIKYTPRGGRIDVHASANQQSVEITVSDTGTGIADQDLPRIFDRLYRGDQSRATRGLGLGLSLVKAYVEAQGGTVVRKQHAWNGFHLRRPGCRTLQRCNAPVTLLKVAPASE